MPDPEHLVRHFRAMGAQLDVVGNSGRATIDISRDRRGERFSLTFDNGAGAAQLEVLDVDRAGRHLLLLMRDGDEKSKFLCGHDERHWFVAAVPEREAGVTGVKSAKRALQPPAVRERASRLRRRERDSRRNSAFIRQGEWFFIPADIEVDERAVLRREPISRGRGSKAHVLDEAWRDGGETIYVHRTKAPTGISEREWMQLDVSERREYTRRSRPSALYARGAVRHADHATIHLDGWHRVEMNTESQSSFGASRMAFVD
jgi:hypothetical protein